MFITLLVLRFYDVLWYSSLLKDSCWCTTYWNTHILKGNTKTILIDWSQVLCFLMNMKSSLYIWVTDILLGAMSWKQNLFHLVLKWTDRKRESAVWKFFWVVFPLQELSWDGKAVHWWIMWWAPDLPLCSCAFILHSVAMCDLSRFCLDSFQCEHEKSHFTPC